MLRLWRRSPWTDEIISYGTVLFRGRKSTREKTTERKERRFRAVSVRAFCFIQLFRVLCVVSALLFSPTRKEPKRGPLKTTTTEREREERRKAVQESAQRRERFWSRFLTVLCFFLPLFSHKTNRREIWLTRRRDKKCNHLHHNRPCRWRDDWSPNQSRELSKEEGKEAGYF